LFSLQNEKRKLGGIDYSKALISLANTFFKSNDFIHNEAIFMDTKVKFDLVLSHSVFQYFSDYQYAKKVLLAMIEKANYKVAIFDVNDISKEQDYHKMRMQHMGEKEYQEKYQDLNHLFYKKEWFEEIADELNLKCEIYDQSFFKYENAKLRFNVIITK